MTYVVCGMTTGMWYDNWPAGLPYLGAYVLVREDDITFSSAVNTCFYRMTVLTVI